MQSVLYPSSVLANRSLVNDTSWVFQEKVLLKLFWEGRKKEKGKKLTGNACEGYGSVIFWKMTLDTKNSLVLCLVTANSRTTPGPHCGAKNRRFAGTNKVFPNPNSFLQFIVVKKKMSTSQLFNVQFHLGSRMQTSPDPLAQLLGTLELSRNQFSSQWPNLLAIHVDPIIPGTHSSSDNSAVAHLRLFCELLHVEVEP